MALVDTLSKSSIVVTGHITEPEYTKHRPSISPPSGATIEDCHRTGDRRRWLFRICCFIYSVLKFGHTQNAVTNVL